MGHWPRDRAEAVLAVRLSNVMVNYLVLNYLFEVGV